ncbi:PREDICTED: alpha-1,3/1,6-mannosyltransferase ALG2-like [Nicrophorus vespilloides]|uniref:Alpha-1,3/1,6-mannosyltransferase ALG2 n=1 Tax=Nicrophorus vespilloides TaxID=110193 RepID=A0ABM1MGJ0_NICVS|nr:PREDICTED: alpha-1,3/1,6-mannosyltransferase ALG2-like [Nicrophorus vespilloides]
MVKLNNLKLAFVHPDLGIGGAERLVLDVAVAVADQGVQVHFLTNHFDKGHAFEELKTDRFPVKVFGDWMPRGVFGAFKAFFAYLRMLYLAMFHYILLPFDSDSPDIYFVDQIPMAVPILKWTGRKVIYYCHHPDLLASTPGGFLKRLYRKPINWIEMYGTKSADFILVNSEYTAAVFRRTFPQIKNPIKIVYPTIASSFLTDIKKASKKPIHQIAPEIQIGKPDDVVFLSINRYHPAKMLELAIEAMDELRGLLDNDDWSRVHLIIAGGYDPQNGLNSIYFKKLVELTHAKDLIVKITFLKSPSDKLKADLLKSCDCLMYTPVNEHFGIVPLEAMAAAKPVIACNSGGPKETIEHNVTGFLSQPNSVSLAKCMAKILDTQRTKELGKCGLERLERLFSYNNFAVKCMDIVNDAYVTKKDS